VYLCRHMFNHCLRGHCWEVQLQWVHLVLHNPDGCRLSHSDTLGLGGGRVACRYVSTGRIYLLIIIFFKGIFMTLVVLELFTLPEACVLLLELLFWDLGLAGLVRMARLGT
jgi:hypothetical protein